MKTKIMTLGAMLLMLTMSACREESDMLVSYNQNDVLVFGKANESFVEQFEVFWNGMNQNYAIWDYEEDQYGLDWDEVYDRFLPLFEQLDQRDKDTNPVSDSEYQALIDSLAKPLHDGHFVVQFKNPHTGNALNCYPGKIRNASRDDYEASQDFVPSLAAYVSDGTATDYQSGCTSQHHLAIMFGNTYDVNKNIIINPNYGLGYVVAQINELKAKQSPTSTQRMRLTQLQNLFAEWVLYKASVNNRAELISLYNYIVNKYQSLKVPGLILISSAFDEYGLGVQYALLNGDTPYFAFTNFFLTLYANPQYSIINQLTPGSDDYKQSVAIYNAWLSWLKKVQELKANGKLKGVIIDLRSNGGGMFYDFGLVLGSLFQPGTDLQVGYHRYKRGPGRYDYSPLMPDTRPGIDIVELLPNEPSVQNIQQQGITEPIVVLTNCMSVSMAEMTAMGAKAMPNARVIGKRTFGGLCGLVGNESASYNYSGHIGIMGKTAVYCYTPTVATIQPDGKTILEGIGVTPDIEVNYVVTPAGTDSQIDRALQYIQTGN